MLHSGRTYRYKKIDCLPTTNLLLTLNLIPWKRCKGTSVANNMQTSHEKNDEILCTPRNLEYQPYTIHQERRKPSKNSAHPFPPNLFHPFSFSAFSWHYLLDLKTALHNQRHQNKPRMTSLELNSARRSWKTDNMVDDKTHYTIHIKPTFPHSTKVHLVHKTKLTCLSSLINIKFHLWIRDLLTKQISPHWQ